MKVQLDPELLELDLLNATEALTECLIEQHAIEEELLRNHCPTEHLILTAMQVQIRRRIRRATILFIVRRRKLLEYQYDDSIN